MFGRGKPFRRKNLYVVIEEAMRFPAPYRMTVLIIESRLRRAEREHDEAAVRRWRGLALALSGESYLVAVRLKTGDVMPVDWRYRPDLMDRPAQIREAIQISAMHTRLMTAAGETAEAAEWARVLGQLHVMTEHAG